MTESGVRVVIDNELKDSWTPDEGLSVNLCSVNKSQILLGVKDTLVYLLIEPDGRLVEQGKKKMENEIACVDLSPLNNELSEICAIGLWNDISVTLLSLPQMELLDKAGVEIFCRGFF